MKKQYEMPQTEVILMEATVMNTISGSMGDADSPGKARIFEDEWSEEL